jgi:hypothetical protein
MSTANGIPALHVLPLASVHGLPLPSMQRLRELSAAAATSPDAEFVRMSSGELLALTQAAAMMRNGFSVAIDTVPDAPSRQFGALATLRDLVRRQMAAGRRS